MLKLISSGVKCIFVPPKQQPGAKYLEKNVMGTFGLWGSQAMIL